MDKDLLNLRLLKHRSIDSKTSCWNYSGKNVAPDNDFDYARINIDKKIYLVHRVAAHIWLDFDLNCDLLICHKCDNRRCFNPEHLFVGNHKENNNDALDKGRSAIGSRHGKAILVEDQVVLIKKLFKEGMTRHQIASKLNIKYTNVRSIIANENWRHIHG